MDTVFVLKRYSDILTALAHEEDAQRLEGFELRRHNNEYTLIRTFTSLTKCLIFFHLVLFILIHSDYGRDDLKRVKMCFVVR